MSYIYSKLYPYKAALVQGLRPTDNEKRLTFISYKVSSTYFVKNLMD